MLKSQIFVLHKILALFFLLVNICYGLNTDGVLLLSFKYNILSDPLGVLDSWNFDDQTPCSWNGVRCGNNFEGVVNVSLPNSHLLGSLPANLGMIQSLQSLDLSNNSINGSIPFSLYNISNLRILDLSNNFISGELSELVGGLNNLEFLDLSDNELAGNIPGNLSSLPNLTFVSLRSNYFSGSLPSGFSSVQVLDLSSNLINGSLPSTFGGNNLRYLNLSYNRISGKIPLEFGHKIPTNLTLDLSVNNLTGPVPESSVFNNQETKSFSGNSELCGKPLKTLCPVQPSVTESTSPPAIAAIPKTISSSPASGNGTSFKVSTIVEIVVGDVLGIGILVVISMYAYKLKKKKIDKRQVKEEAKEFDWASSSSTDDEKKWLCSWACCNKHKNNDSSSSSSGSSSSDEEKDMEKNQRPEVVEKRSGSLVTVDGGEKELELETLLKASAYILGATGSSIMYKAVLEDGTTLAVRRIGESGLGRFRDFENQVRVIAKLVHPNLVKIRGFYWGTDEKLVIYDFVPNGNLANARYRKAGSSPCSVPWEVRLKIARGMARGLTYIHDKKHVHGNLKPTNILLGEDMEPRIGDFGLERLIIDNSCKCSLSARNFGSKRSSASRDSFQDVAGGATPSPSPSALGCSPYYAPESLRSLKPNPKWDVYSFGVVLLELLTGKVIVTDELGPAIVIGNATVEDEEKNKILRMADVAIRGDMEGKEESLLALLKLGYSCISPMPQKRPAMKEALQILEKFPFSS